MTLSDTAVEFTREEIVAELERAARVVNMSVPELVKSFRDGTLRQKSAIFDALALIEILPPDDPLNR